MHGREVTKPHVSQFMQVNVCVDLIGTIGSLIGGLQNVICKSYGANILHCANSELRYIDHIIFGEGEIVAE